MKNLDIISNNPEIPAKIYKFSTESAACRLSKLKSFLTSEILKAENYVVKYEKQLKFKVKRYQDKDPQRYVNMQSDLDTVRAGIRQEIRNLSEIETELDSATPLSRLMKEDLGDKIDLLDDSLGILAGPVTEHATKMNADPKYRTEREISGINAMNNILTNCRGKVNYIQKALSILENEKLTVFERMQQVYDLNFEYSQNQVQNHTNDFIGTWIYKRFLDPTVELSSIPYSTSCGTRNCARKIKVVCNEDSLDY